MQLIQQITTAPLQKQRFVLDDGTAFDFTLYFRPMQSGWFIEELTYLERTWRTIRVSNNPNMLYQWKNLIPFGIACFSTANREPTFQQDFASGASKLYVLNAAEVAEYSEILALG